MHRGLLACVCFGAVACAGNGGSSPTASWVRSGDWSCLGDGGRATVHAAVQPPGEFDVALQDAYTHAPVGGERLAVCARADESCASPVSQATADDMGRARLSAPGGPSSFDGFVRVSGSDIATHYAFLPNRAASCLTCAITLPLYTPAAMRTTAATTQWTLDASDAWVRVDVEDCAGAPAEGATVSIGSFGCRDAGAAPAPGGIRLPFGTETCPGPVVAYATGGHGTVSRTALSTDATGVSLGFGVPVGPLGIAEVVDHGAVAGALGFARAGAVSTFVVRP